MAIQNLSQIDTVSLSDQVPIGSTANGGDKRVTVTALAATVGAVVTADATAAATAAALVAVNAALPGLIDAATAGLASNIAANTAAITTKADALPAVEIFISTILTEQAHSKRPLVVSASAVGPVTLTIANQANGGWIYDPDLGATHLSSLDVLNQSAFPVTIAMQNPSVMAIIAGTRYPTIPSQQNGSFDPLASNSWTSSTAAPADVVQVTLAPSNAKAPVVDAVLAGFLTIEPKKYVAPPTSVSFGTVLNAGITAGFQEIALQEQKALSVTPTTTVGSALQIPSSVRVVGSGAQSSVAQVPALSNTVNATMFNQWDGWDGAVIDNFVFDANQSGQVGGTNFALTLSSAAVGAGRTFTSDVPAFSPTDVGRVIYTSAAPGASAGPQATITAYTSPTQVTASITVVFPGTSILTGLSCVGQLSMFGIVNNAAGCSNLTFERTIFKGTKNSPFFIINGPGWKFDRCTFADSTHQMILVGSTNIAPDACSFSACKFTNWGIVGGSACITLGRNVRNIRFNNCEWLNIAACPSQQFAIEGSGAGPGNITAAQCVQVANCYFDGNDGADGQGGNWGVSKVGISQVSNDSVFSGNTFRRCYGGYAFETGGHRNIFIGNTLQDALLWHNVSLELDGCCHDVKIIGNTLRFSGPATGQTKAIQVRNQIDCLIWGNTVDFSQLPALTNAQGISIGANVSGVGSNFSQRVTIENNTVFASTSEDGGTTQAGSQGIVFSDALLGSTTKGLDTTTNFAVTNISNTAVGAGRTITTDIPTFLNPRDTGRTVTYSGGGVGTITSIQSTTQATMTISTLFTSATPAAGSVTLGAQAMLANQTIITKNKVYGLQFAVWNFRGLGTQCRIYENNFFSNSSGQFTGDFVTNDPEIRDNLGPSGYTLLPAFATDADAAAGTGGLAKVALGRYYWNTTVNADVQRRV